MLESSTLNRLVRYIYKETNLTENLSIWHELDQNEDLRQTYQDLKGVTKSLGKMLLKPSEVSINKIKRYSQNSAC